MFGNSEILSEGDVQFSTEFMMFFHSTNSVPNFSGLLGADIADFS